MEELQETYQEWYGAAGSLVSEEGLGLEEEQWTLEANQPSLQVAIVAAGHHALVATVELAEQRD